MAKDKSKKESKTNSKGEENYIAEHIEPEVKPKKKKEKTKKPANEKDSGEVEHKAIAKVQKEDGNVLLAPESGIKPEPASEPASAAGQAKKNKKRRRAQDKVDENTLTEEERIRRQKQRQQRELASKLRESGKEYSHKDFRRAQEKEERRKNPVKKEKKDRGERSKGRKDAKCFLGDKQPGWRPMNSTIDVLILPIFWNHAKEEKGGVMKVAEQVRTVLEGSGVSCDVDASTKYTPGQKMKYWETMGVRVRVEVGPRDVEDRKCVIAVATGMPGEVAEKSRLPIHELREKILATIARVKAKYGGGRAQKAEDKAEETAEVQEEEAADEAAAPAAKRQKKAAEEAKEEVEEEKKEEEETGAAAAPTKFESADALEDDFGDTIAFEAEEEKLTLSKKDRIKKQHKVNKKLRKAGSGPAPFTWEDSGKNSGGGEGERMPALEKMGLGSEGPSKKAKKAKVVTF